MKHHSSYPGTLVLPSGAEIARGAEVDLTEDEMKNEAVAGWISSGWLTNGKAGAVEVSEDVGALKAQIAAMIEANGQLQAEVSRLSSEIEALTAPPAGPQPTGYVVSDKAPGWMVVTQNGVEVTKALRKAAVDSFDALDDEAKAAFVEANKPE